MKKLLSCLLVFVSMATIAASAAEKLTPKQLEANHLLAGPQRHTLLVGGSRSGKTFVLVRAIVLRALKSPNSAHAILRYRQNAVRLSVWNDTLPTVVRKSFPTLKLKAGAWNVSNCMLTLPNGATIWCSGLDEKDRVEKILGTEFNTILFNECSQIPYHSVTTALTRLARKSECTYEVQENGAWVRKTGELTNRAYFDLNPVGKTHYTHRLFIQHKKVDSQESLKDPNDYASLFMNPEDNAENIDPAYIKALHELPYQQQQRYLLGKYVDEIEGALWSFATIEQQRVSLEDLPEMVRIIVAVDPSGASGPESGSDAIGIVAAGKGVDGHGYLLRDRTILDKPEKWGKEVIWLYGDARADRVVAEQNFGGDMVRAVIHLIEPTIPFKLVNASRGKSVRAEPISALTDMGMIHHVGAFPELEDELCGFSRDGYTGTRSPNRADAYVWAFTELFPEFVKHRYGLIEAAMSEQKKSEEVGQRTFSQDLEAAQKQYDEQLSGMVDSSVYNPGHDKAAVTKPEMNKIMATPAEGKNPTRVCATCGAAALSPVPGGGMRCQMCGNQVGGRVTNFQQASRADLFQK